MKQQFKHMSVTLCILCATVVAGADGSHDARFLGRYDFVAGKGEGVEAGVTPEGEFTVGDFDGMRLLRIVPSKSVSIEIKPGQQDPAFPIANAEAAGKQREIRINLTLTDKEARGIDPKTAMNVMVVLEFYDVAYAGNFGGPRPLDIAAHGGRAFGYFSGSDWGNMPMTRARIRRRPYLLEKVTLDGRACKGVDADISIQVNGHLLLRSIEFYRTDAADIAWFEQRLRELNKRQLVLLRKRALVEDRADQARLMMVYLGRAESRLCRRAAQTRAAVLAGIEAMETAVDDCYFEGRVDVARGDRDAVENAFAAIAGQIDAIDRQLSGLDELAEQTAAAAMAEARGKKENWWFSPLRAAPQPMPFIGAKMNPAERILFVSAEGGYSYKHDWMLPYAQSVGVNFRPLWYMYPGLNEDRQSFASYRGDDTRQAGFSQEYMTGLGSSVWTYRHNYIIPLPDWFKKAYEGRTDIWDWNGAGERKGNLNPFNDEVRKLFVDHHREIARRHRHTPRWNMAVLGVEGMQRSMGGGGCENGYSPSAVAKFRAYLQDIYGSVTNLNAELATDYAAFDAIDPPPDMGIQLRRRPGPLDYHFERFRRRCMVDVFEMSAHAMKAESPEMKTWFESMARFDLTAADGLDTYNMFRVADAAATHSQGELNPIWNMSMLRYFPGTIYAKQEHKPAENETHCDPDVEMLGAATRAGWTQELICGNRGLGNWSAPWSYVRHLEFYGPYMHDARHDVLPFRHSGVSAVFRKRADMWLPLLNNLRWKDPKVGMLYSVTSQMIGWPYQEIEFEGFGLHHSLFYNSIPYFVIHEDAIADTRESLGLYRVIVAPYAPLIQRETVGEWINWIRVGGVLLSSGPFGVHDQYGREDLRVLRAVFGQSLKAEYASDEIAVAGSNRLDAASVAYLRGNGILDVDSVSGWFWNISFDKLPETARVLLRLEDGRPVLLEGEHEGGRVMFSACGSFANQLGALYVNQLRRRIVPFAQPARPYGLAAFPLTDAVHHLYLAVINFDYYNTVRDTITLDAAVRRVVDVGIEHGFPVPFRATETTTEIDLELPPGGSALLDLGYEADMTWTVRQINEDGGTLAAALPDVYTARLEAIAASGLPPDARREAWALAALARRWASRGIASKAQAYAKAAESVKAAPAFISFDGERVKARRVGKPIAIDGKLDDWPNAESHALKGSDISGGSFQTAYDDAALYLAVVVRDAAVKNFGEEGAGCHWSYACDGVNVSLNPSDTANKVPSGIVDAPLHDGYANLTFSVSGRMKAMPFTCLPPAHAQSATRRLDAGYVMEIAIPLEDYGILPAEGASIGFDIGLRGATGTFSRYATRDGRTFDGKRLARLYFE